MLEVRARHAAERVVEYLLDKLEEQAEREAMEPIERERREREEREWKLERWFRVFAPSEMTGDEMRLEVGAACSLVGSESVEWPAERSGQLQLYLHWCVPRQPYTAQLPQPWSGRRVSPPPRPRHPTRH